MSEEDVKNAYQEAMMGMARLNRVAAKLMHKFHAHAATDVTGFGILGHAGNLAANQKAEVSFVIESLPIYAHMHAVAKASPINFKLVDGYSAETSGDFDCFHFYVSNISFTQTKKKLTHFLLHT